MAGRIWYTENVIMCAEAQLGADRFTGGAESEASAALPYGVGVHLPAAPVGAGASTARLGRLPPNEPLAQTV